MKYLLVAGLATTAALLLGACQTAQEQSEATTVQSSPNDEREYRAITLDNDLTMVLVRDPDAEKSGAALSVQVGSLQNPDEHLGLAHYLEHMLFLGTENYPDPDEYGEFMSRHGGSHNAYTADDHTNYMFEVNNSALPEALDRFSDFFKAPKFYPEYSEKEINAVDSEWSMRRDSDGFILFALNNKTLNPEHPIARFRIGNAETLGDSEESVLHDAMLDFYERYYSANLMTAAVVSNRSLDELEELTRTAFGEIPNHEATIEPIEVPAVTENERGVQLFYRPQMEMRMLMLDFTVPNNLDAYPHKPNQVIAHLISSEMPGTPGAFFRDQGWVDSLSASASPMAYGNEGRFRITAELTEAGLAERETMTGVLLDYVEMLRQTGIDEKYADEMATVLNNEFRFLERTGAYDYATQLARDLAYYPIHHVVSHPYHFTGFDADRVNEVLAHLTPDNLRLWYISQAEETDQELHFFDANYRTEQLTAADFQRFADAAEGIIVGLPEVNTLLPEDLSVKPGEPSDKPQQVVAEPGISAWYQRSERFAEPRANVSVQLNQPFTEASLRERMAGTILQDMFNRSQRPLSREASIAGVDFSFSIMQGIQLELSGFHDKQAQLAERLLTGFSELELTEAQLERSRDRVRRNLENFSRQFPVQQLYPRFSRLVQQPSYGFAEQLAELPDVTVDDLRAVQQRLLEDNYLRIFAFGNYTGDEVVELTNRIATYAGVNPERQFSRGRVTTPQAGSHVNLQHDLDQDDTAVLDLLLLDQPDLGVRARLQVLNGHLSNRVFNQLRTEEQLGYAVGSAAVPLRDYSGLAFLIQSPVKGPTGLVERFAEFRQEYLEDLLEMSDERFAEARSSVLTELTQPPSNLGEEAARVREDWQRENYDFDTRARLIAEVESVTLPEVQELYQQILDGEGVSRVLIQLRGQTFADEDFGSIEGAEVITTPSDWGGF